MHLIIQLTAIITLVTLPLFSITQEGVQMFLVHEDEVITSEMSDYMKAAEKLKQAMVDHNITDKAYYMYSTDDNRFLYVSPIESYAALDNPTFASLAKELGKDHMQKLLSNFEGTYTNQRQYIIHYHPELSFNADKFHPEDNNYYHWLIKQVHTDKYEKFIEHLKDWKTLYEKTTPAPKYGYSVYTGGIGTDQPFSYIMFWGENKVDFHTEYQEVAQRQGEPRKALSPIMQSLLKESNKVEGRYHPELSHPRPSEIETARENE